MTMQLSNFDIPPGSIPGMPMPDGRMHQPEEPMAPGDERLFVQFYMGAVKDDEASAAAGHPVFRSTPFVKIMVPGDKNTVIDTFADEQYQRRFSKLWNAFTANEKQELVGFPIKEWPAITRAQAEELMYLNIRTVEQLASLADVYGSRIMGFNDLKRKAEAFLANAKDAAFAEKLSTENSALKAMIDAQAEEIKKLSAKFEASQTKKG
jgi:hypothetical protein